MAPMRHQLKQLHAMMARAGMNPPPFEPWAAQYADNAALWPMMGPHGKIAGAALFKGNFVHLVIDPKYHGRWITKAVLRGYREWTHPIPIYATPAVDNAKAIELCRRLGMAHQGQDPTGQYEVFIKPATPQPETGIPVTAPAATDTIH